MVKTSLLFLSALAIWLVVPIVRTLGSVFSPGSEDLLEIAGDGLFLLACVSLFARKAIALLREANETPEDGIHARKSAGGSVTR